MINHSLPYIDTGDLNLDWLIKNMRQILTEWVQYQETINNQYDTLTEAFNALKNWIDSWFDNLDVQEEINNKLDAMAASGELLTIIAPTVRTETDTWLAAHVTQETGYVLDDTLKLANAAAQSKAVGDKITNQVMKWTAQLASGDDLDDLYLPGWYIVPYAASLINAPEDVTSKYRYVLVITTSTPSASAFKQMIYINQSSNTMYARSMTSSTWNSWHTMIEGMLSTGLTETNLAAQAKKVGDELADIRLDAMNWKGEVAGTDDLDDLYEPGWYIVQYSATPTHAPEDVTNKHRYILIFTTSTPSAGGFKHMIYINREDSTAFIRMMTSGSWDSWTIPMADQIYNSKEELLWHSRALGTLYNYDLDAVSLPGWYNVATGSTLTNYPPGEAASGGRRQIWVTAVPPDRTQRFMIYFNYTTGLVAWRIYYSSAWRDWYFLKQADNVEKEIYRTPDYFTEPIEFAHRGCYLGGIAPQNTLPAFREAVEQEYNGIESDVQITSDNIPVMIHDRNISVTGRNPDGTEIGETINIDTVTFEQANEYDYGIRISAEFAGTKLMSLVDFLTFCRRTGVKPLIHLKETITQAKFPYIKQALIDSGMMYDTIMMEGDKTRLGQMADYFEKCMIGLTGNSSDFGSDIPDLFKSWKKNGNVLFFVGGSTFYADETRGPIVQQIIDDGVIPISVFAQTSSVQTAPGWVYLSLVNPADAAVGYFHPQEILYNLAMGIVE